MTDPQRDDTRNLQTYEQADESLDAKQDIERVHAAIIREKVEPREGFQPIPMTLLVCLFALLMWGGWYLGEYDAGYQPDRLDGPDAFVTIQAESDAEPVKLDPLLVGKRLFNNCVTCHQSHGNGAATYPPLNGSEWVNGRPEVFAAILLKGINGPFEVDGRTYNAEMPPWGAKLTDFEIASVITYVRSSWNNRSSAVDEELVKQVRGSVNRANHWTMSELIEYRKGLPEPVPVEAVNANQDSKLP